MKQALEHKTENKPGLLKSIFEMRCPRCRKGKLFAAYSAYNFNHTLDMHEHCGVCRQDFDLEPGFWYGTGYVSYALAIALSFATIIAWYIFIGLGLDDNRVFWWLGTNTVLLITLQPWIMRLSRTIYLYFFIRYKGHYKNVKKEEPKECMYENEMA